jgi:molybdopterin molybdotransferase
MALQGATQSIEIAMQSAVAQFDWPRADARQEFLRVRRNAQGGLELYPNQSSGVLTSAVWGDGVVDNPAGKTIAKGDVVNFISFSEWMA